jgi:hypothetical protein
MLLNHIDRLVAWLLDFHQKFLSRESSGGRLFFWLTPSRDDTPKIYRKEKPPQKKENQNTENAAIEWIAQLTVAKSDGIGTVRCGAVRDSASSCVCGER